MELATDKLEEICQLCDVEIANINCAEQIIITGVGDTVDRAMDLSTEAGAKKCVKLNVSGPWHSRCMSLAREKFEPVVRQCNFRDPNIPVINNVDGKPLESGAEAPQKLVDQLCGSVLWQQSIEWMLNAGFNQ